MVDSRLKRKKRDSFIHPRRFRKDFIIKSKTEVNNINNLFFCYFRFSNKSGSILGRYLESQGSLNSIKDSHN